MCFLSPFLGVEWRNKGCKVRAGRGGGGWADFELGIFLSIVSDNILLIAASIFFYFKTANQM